jgi:hypothetical protein
MHDRERPEAGITGPEGRHVMTLVGYMRDMRDPRHGRQVKWWCGQITKLFRALD